MTLTRDLSISIVIPTYNRSHLLIRVLQALEGQRFPFHRFEVIIVDDGSSDDTQRLVLDFKARSPLNIQYFYQQNKKQGAARNLGIRHARFPLLLFIGDDILPDHAFLAQHLAFYERLDDPEMSAVIGYTPWSPDLTVTPFMEFIGAYGHQFGYALIQGNGPLPFNFYYTSNLMIPLSTINRLDRWFDEDFHSYGWEDIELGFRLERAGVFLYYNPHAVGFHHHPMDVDAFCLRQQKVGYSSNIFVKKHPELCPFLGEKKHLETRAQAYLKARIYQKTVHYLDKYLGVSFPHEIYRFVLDTHYAKGAVVDFNPS